jgi:phosphoribosylamine--glycine ligase
MAAEGTPFVGVLYGGFMLTARGPVVLEFNCRFGDPETQALVSERIQFCVKYLSHLCGSDCFCSCRCWRATCTTCAPAARRGLCAAGTLRAEDVRWKPQVACAVVCAAAGYPGPNYTRGALIRGLDQIPQLQLGDALQVYHSGAALADERDPAAGVVTTGGRVLTVTGIATTLREAQRIAYEGVQAISFEGMHFRKDIGDR